MDVDDGFVSKAGHPPKVQPDRIGLDGFKPLISAGMFGKSFQDGIVGQDRCRGIPFGLAGIYEIGDDLVERF